MGQTRYGRFLVASLALLAVPALCAGQSDTRVVKPEIRVGDSWTYRGRNLLGPGVQEYETRVSFIDDKVILTISTRKNDGKEIDAAWTSEWNAVTSYTGRMARPHVGIFRFPLRVGESFEAKSEWLDPRNKGAEGISTGTVRIVGWETVEVPAGKFRAMKIESEFLVRSPDGRSSQFKIVYWYVPEVRRWVKLNVVGSQGGTVGEELLAYKLNED